MFNKKKPAGIGQRKWPPSSPTTCISSAISSSATACAWMVMSRATTGPRGRTDAAGAERPGLDHGQCRGLRHRRQRHHHGRCPGGAPRELQSNARVTGNIRYQQLRMDVGASVEGKLTRRDSAAAVAAAVDSAPVDAAALAGANPVEPENRMTGPQPLLPQPDAVTARAGRGPARYCHRRRVSCRTRRALRAPGPRARRRPGVHGRIRNASVPRGPRLAPRDTASAARPTVPSPFKRQTHMLINCVAYQDGRKLADFAMEDISDYRGAPRMLRLGRAEGPRPGRARGDAGRIRPARTGRRGCPHRPPASQDRGIRRFAVRRHADGRNGRTAS